MKSSLRPMRNRPLKLWPPAWLIEVGSWIAVLMIVLALWRLGVWATGADR